MFASVFFMQIWVCLFIKLYKMLIRRYIVLKNHKTDVQKTEVK